MTQFHLDPRRIVPGAEARGRTGGYELHPAFDHDLCRLGVFIDDFQRRRRRRGKQEGERKRRPRQRSHSLKSVTYQIATGLPGEPVAPTSFNGAQTNRNSVTPASSSGAKSRFSRFQMPRRVCNSVWHGTA